MRNRPVLTSLAITAALSLALTACGSSDDDSTEANASLDLVKAGTLTVCSDVPYAPFEDFDEEAESGFTGFDVDLVAAIAEGLDLDLTIRDSDFDALQSGLLLNGKQCDLGASAMTITEERKENLLFSDGYYTSQQSLLVPADSDITSLADLAGKKVGVQKGTTGETYTAENAPDAEPVQYGDDGKLYLALKAGQIDAILQDLPVNIEHQRDPKEPGRFKVVETYDTAENYGFAASKANTALIEAVNAELKALRDSGEYQTIFDTYFGVN